MYKFEEYIYRIMYTYIIMDLYIFQYWFDNYYNS